MRSSLVILTILTLTGSAFAEERPPIRRWVDLQLGTHVALADSAELSEETDRLRLSASASVYLLDRLALGVRGRFGVPGDPDHNYEALATVSYSYLKLPLVELFAGTGLGYYWREIWGSDWVFNDQGFTANLDLGLRLNVSRWVSPSVIFTYTLSQSEHDERNSSYPGWTHGLLAGLALSFTL